MFWLRLGWPWASSEVNEDQKVSFTYAELKNCGDRLMTDDREDVPNDFHIATLCSF
jgi:hypothetical protein